MPRILRKNFYHYCFPNFKCLPTTLSLPFEEDDEGEKNEYSHNNSNTSNNIPTSITKNFNTVFDIPCDSTTSKSLTSSTTEDYIFEDSDSDNTHDYVPDFSTVFASQRFFFSSPGNSNSIVDFPVTTSPEKHEQIVTGGVAIQTYSPDPYSDFRRSMHEMVEAHELTDVKANWEYLHELLLCYLNLNPKHTHKYIVGAFSDLVVSLMSSTTTATHDNDGPKIDEQQQQQHRIESSSQRLV